MQVSQRFHNDTYAPGIATYGITGKPGDTGNPGTCMFFTDFEIMNNDFKQFVQKITSRMLPIKNKEIVLDRKYINGDIFVTKQGIVYILKNIKELSTISMNGEQNINPEDYLEQIGVFSKDTENDIFYNQNEDLRINKLTIEETDTNNRVNQGLLNINKINPGNGEIVFIDMKSLYGAAPNQELKISYDNSIKGYKISSEYPIVIDSNVYVKQNTSKQISEYSPVLTTNNSITDFFGLCRDINYNIDASVYTYTKQDSSTIYYGSIYIITLNDENQNLINRFTNENVMLHFQNKEFQDFQLYRDSEYTYYFKQDYEYVKLNDIINNIKYNELNDIQLSLIYNIEIYLTKNNKELVGFKN